MRRPWGCTRGAQPPSLLFPWRRNAAITQVLLHALNELRQKSPRLARKVKRRLTIGADLHQIELVTREEDVVDRLELRLRGPDVVSVSIRSRLPNLRGRELHSCTADSRDEAAQVRLDILNERKRVWRCRTTFNCTDACPRGIQVTKTIADVKQAMMTGVKP